MERVKTRRALLKAGVLAFGMDRAWLWRNISRSSPGVWKARLQKQSLPAQTIDRSTCGGRFRCSHCTYPLGTPCEQPPLTEKYRMMETTTECF
jgi:hypothetical protein